MMVYIWAASLEGKLAASFWFKMCTPSSTVGTQGGSRWPKEQVLEGNQKTGRSAGQLCLHLNGGASCWSCPVHCRENKLRLWNSLSCREHEDALASLPNPCSVSVLFGNSFLEIDVQIWKTPSFNLKAIFHLSTFCSLYSFSDWMLKLITETPSDTRGAVATR